MRATGVDSYDAYYDRLCKASLQRPEWERFLQEVTTHETYLFRDEKNWDWLRETFLPELVRDAAGGKRRKTVRIWSAACSTGTRPIRWPLAWPTACRRSPIGT